VIRAAVQRGTSEKLNRLKKTLQLHHNSVGRLLDLFADVLVEAAEGIDPLTLRREGYARLSPAAVRSIRKSTDKILSLAMEHGVSESLVVKIRARDAYRWVR